MSQPGGWLGERGCTCALFTLHPLRGTPACLTPEVWQGRWPSHGEGSGASPVLQLSCSCPAFTTVPTHGTASRARAASQNQRQGPPACPKGPAITSPTAHLRLPGRAHEQGEALQHPPHLQSTLFASHRQCIPSQAAGAEIKHVNTSLTVCLSTIQQHSITALSTLSALSLGMVLKRELEAGGGGQGGQSELICSVLLWMLWMGSCCLGSGGLCLGLAGIQVVNWCSAGAGPGSR